MVSPILSPQKADVSQASMRHSGSITSANLPEVQQLDILQALEEKSIKLSHVESQYELAIAQVVGLKTNVAELERRVKEAEESKGSMVQATQLEAIQTERALLETEHSNLKSQLQRRQVDVQDVEQRSAALQRDVDALQRELAEQRAQRERHRSLEDEYQRLVLAYESQNQQLQAAAAERTALVELTSQLQLLVNQNNSMTAELQTLKAEKVLSEDTIRKLIMSIQSLEEHDHATTSASEGTSNLAISELKAQLESESASKANLLSVTENLSKQLATLEAAGQTASAERAALLSTVASLEAEIVSMQTATQQLRESQEIENVGVQARMAEIEERSDELLELQAQKKQLEVEHERQVRELKEELEAARRAQPTDEAAAATNEIIEKLQDAESRSADLAHQVQDMEAQLKQLRASDDALQTIREENSSYRLQLESLQSEIAKLQVDMQSRQEELLRLNESSLRQQSAVLAPSDSLEETRQVRPESSPPGGSMDEQIDVFRRSAKDSQDALAAAQERQESLGREIAALNTALANKSEILEEFQMMAQDANGEIQRLQAELTASRSQLAAVPAAAAEAAASDEKANEALRAQLQAAYDELSESHALVRSELEAMRNAEADRISAMEADAQAQARELAVVKQALEDALAGLASSQEMAHEVEMTLIATEQKHNELQRSFEDAKASWNDERTAIQEALANAQADRQASMTLRDASECTEAALQSSEQARRELQRELDAARANLEMEMKAKEEAMQKADAVLQEQSARYQLLEANAAEAQTLSASLTAELANVAALQATIQEQSLTTAEMESKLLARIADLEQSCASLKEQLAVASASSASIQELQSRNETLLQTVEEYRSKASADETTLNGRCRLLEEQLAAADSANKAREAELQQQILAADEGKREALVAWTEALGVANLQDAVARFEVLRAQAGTAADADMLVKQELESARAALAAVEAEVEVLKADLSSRKNSADRMIEAEAAKDVELKSSLSRIAELDNLLSIKSGEFDARDEQLRLLESQKTSAEQTLAAEVLSLRQGLAQLQAKLEAQQTQHSAPVGDDPSQQIESLRAENARLIEENRKLCELPALPVEQFEFESQIEELTKTLATSKAEAEQKLKLQQDALSKETFSLYGKIRQLEADKLTLQRERDEVSEQLARLQLGGPGPGIAKAGVEPNGPVSGVPSGKFCELCESPGHTSEDCPNAAAVQAPPSQVGRKGPYCEYCEQDGHSMEDCDRATDVF